MLRKISEWFMSSQLGNGHRLAGPTSGSSKKNGRSKGFSVRRSPVVETLESRLLLSVVANNPPVAVADGPYFANANELLEISSPGLLSNDSDIDGDALSVSNVNITGTIGQITASSLGGFKFNPNGQFDYLAQDETATTTFTYRAYDGVDHSVLPVTVTIIISGANDIPVISSLSVDPPTIFESDTTAISGSFTDINTSESHTVSVDWGDSSTPSTISLDPGVVSFVSNHQYLDEGTGTFPIQVTVTDSSGGSDTSTTSVGVSNVSPTVNAGIDQMVVENETVSFAGNFTDPGSLDTQTMTWNFGDGSPAVTGTLAPVHVYPDNGVYSVSLSVTDNDGGVGTDTMMVTVGNLPPIVNAGIDQTTSEGTALAFSGEVSNPGAGDTYTWNFGDGSPTVTGTLTPVHIFSDNGSYSVTLSVTDIDGGVGTDTSTVTVANVAPTVNAGTDRTIPGGGTLVFSGSVMDPGSVDTFTYTWDFGDGSPVTSGTLSPSHIYTTEGVFTATLTVTDKDGGVGTDTLDVTVTNTAPIVEAGVNQSAVEGAVVLFGGSYTDVTGGPAPTTSWDFGDGSAPVTGTLTPTHAFTDDGVYPVTLSVTDDGGAVGTDTLFVTVGNVAPTVDAGADQATLEGTTVAFSGTVADAGTLDTHTYMWNFGDGSPVVTGTLAPTHAFANSGTYLVSLTVADDDGGVSTDTLTVTVGNIAPVVDAGIDQSTSEGATIVFSGSVTNPSPLDTYSWDFGDSSAPATGTLTPAHMFADNGVFMVTLTVTDDEGGVGTDTLTVTVGNVAPQISAGVDQSIGEGSVASFSGAIVDPGLLDTHTTVWDFGDGSAPVSGTLTPTHVFADDGSYTVTLTVTDDDGGVSTDTLLVTVLNVPPIVNAGADQSTNEGTTVIFSGDVSDPGLYDSHTTTWDFGDGSPTVSGTFTPSHVYAEDGVYTVTASVTDNGGAVGTDTLFVTVGNVAPMVDAGADQATLEGTTVAFSGTVADSGTLDTHTYMWNFGDGSPVVTGTLAPTHAFANSGTYLVSLTVADDDGGVSTDTLTVTVGNVAPIVDVGIDQSSTEGTPTVFSGSITNPSPLNTYSWDFGDGTAPVTGTLTPVHLFADNGVFMVTLTVTDDEGGVGTDTLAVTVGNVAPQVSAGVDQSIGEGSATTFSGAFVDLGSLDTHTMMWDFGDGSAPVSGTLAPTHVFADDGSYTVTLTVTDDDGGVNMDTLLVTVLNVPPIVNAGADQTVDEGTPIFFSGDVSDPGLYDSHTTTWNFGDGTPTVSGTFTPTHIYADNGFYTVTLSVTDNSGAVGTDTVFVTVANVLPTAVDDGPYTVIEDTLLEVDAATGVLSNDVNPGTGTLTATVAVEPLHGQLVLSSDGSFTYQPNVNYFGPDSFGYITSDGVDASTTATVNLNIAPVNDAPIPDNEAAQTDEDTPVVIPVLPGDFDPENDTMTIIGVNLQDMTGAEVTIGSNGELIYDPAGQLGWITEGETFTETFTYIITDGQLTSEGIVTVTILGLHNDAPVAFDDGPYITDEGTLLTVDATSGVLANDTDIEAVHMDALQVVAFDIVSDQGAIVSVAADGSFTYNPSGSAALAALGTGESLADTFTYTVDDMHGGQDTSTVTVIVTGQNSAPIAFADAYTVPEDNSLVIGPLGVLANDTDIESDTLSALLVDLPQNGTLSLSPDGSFLYTPNPNFVGTDGFTYKAADALQQSAAASVSITVTSVQDVPLAMNDSYTVSEDTTLLGTPSVLENDMDLDGDPLSAVLATGPSNGTLTLSPDGSFTYTPSPDYSGFDSFTYMANDGTSNSNVAMVTIVVSQVNDPPTSEQDDYATDENTPLVVPAPGFLANDSDPEGGPLFAIANTTTSAQGANVVVASDGSFTYDPIGQLRWLSVDSTVVDTFDYVVSDNQGAQSTVTVRVTVTGVNEAPTADDDTAITNKDSPVYLDAILLDGDTDPDTQDVLRVVGVIMYETIGEVTLDQGTLLYNPNGQFDYLGLGETATDTFDYIVTDDHGGSDMGTMTVTITGSGVITVNNPPVADDDTAGTFSDTTVEIDVLDGDVDPDSGDSLSVAGVSPTSTLGATLSITASGTILFDPAGNFDGLAPGESVVDTFSYTVTDLFGRTDTAQVSVTVTGQSAVEDLLPLDGTEPSAGTVDFLTLPDQVATTDGLIYAIQPVRDGVLTLQATHDPAQGDLSLVLANSGGVKLASSTGGVMTPLVPAFDASWLAEGGTTGEDRIDVVVTGGDTYYFGLFGDAVETDLILANLLGINGTDVTVFGTDVDDTFVFEPVASYLVTINDLPYHFEDAELTTVSFDGGEGMNTARLVGTPNDETTTLSPGSGNLIGSGFEANVAQCEAITVVGSGGAGDEASFYDSPGNDILRAYDRGATFSGDGFTNIVENFPVIVASSDQGGLDEASLYDSPGDDEFIGVPESGTLSGDGYSFSAQHFDAVHAYAKFGGYDTADLLGSEAEDTYIGKDYYGRLTGEGYLNRAKNFELVVGHAVGEGDLAYLFGSLGDDVFEAGPESATMVSPENEHQIFGFSEVNGYGLSGGGHDIAKLHDTVGNDQLSVYPSEAILTGDGLLLNAYAFEQIEAFSTAGGLDQAELYDSPGDETFNAYPDISTLIGDDFTFQVSGFEGVHAYGSQGGTDVAHLYDSPGDDTYIARLEWGRLIGEDFVTRAKFFDTVNAHADFGGADTAFLYDTTGDDLFVGRPEVSTMEGSERLHRVELFEEVFARSTEGGNDQAVLYDSSFDDLLVAGTDWASVRSASDELDFLYSIHAFESAEAHSSAGNDTSMVDEGALFLDDTDW